MVTRHGAFLRSGAYETGLNAINIFVKTRTTEHSIDYYNEIVQNEILDLPDTLAARYVVLTRRMVALGPNLGEPHTKSMKNGLFELRLKGTEGIARELNIATSRLKEVKHENP